MGLVFGGGAAARFAAWWIGSGRARPVFRSKTGCDSHSTPGRGVAAVRWLADIPYFTTLEGTVAKVEYTFQYKRGADGALKIVVHHSSLPYSP